MPNIIYSLVARDQTVLCEHTDTSGNFPTVTRVMLRKIHENSKGSTATTRSTYNYDQHKFHFLLHDELTYLCMAENEVKTTVAFAMLDELKRQLLEKYGTRAKTAIAYSMNEFSRTIKELMQKYSAENISVDKMDEIHGKMTTVKNIMVENINKVLERGEKIDILVEKTNNLQQEAFKFEKGANSLKRTMWWKNIKLWFIGFILVIILLWLGTSLACGFDYSHCTQGVTNYVHDNTK